MEANRDAVAALECVEFQLGDYDPFSELVKHRNQSQRAGSRDRMVGHVAAAEVP